MRKFSTLLPIALLFLCNANAQTAPVAQSVTSKVICGYQGWFNCYGDGSAVARWKHWSNGTYQSNAGAPAPNFVTFEAYPDVSGYATSSLFQTGLGNLGDGSAAKLFSSYKQDVIDTQFHWMQQYGIDGVALQRFIGETFDGVFKANRDSVAARIKRVAEKYQRVFYLMYDISGLDVTKFDSIKTDWQNNMVGKLQLTSSPYYVHQNGKPVVCLWGFGFTDRPGDASQCIDVINWFKNNGCFVIGGVPTHWRTSDNDSKTGFNNVYASYDMISPWSVGRFNDSTSADNFKTQQLIPDLAYCNNNNLLYQPVAFPGFSWSNFNGGSQNQIPRNKGEFFQRQVYNIKQSGIGNMYVAMFDEYDEGTAIAKMADSYYSIPNNQYFLTASADGTYISPDFYLRLVGKATKAINGTETVTKYVSIPYSAGPIWFRTGVEQKYDAQLSWTDSPEPTMTPTNVIGYLGNGNPELGTVDELSHIGGYSLRYAGRDNSAVTSSFYFRAFDVNIPVDANTTLSFWTYPQSDLARYVSVDLLLSDGTRMSTYGTTDINGIAMRPSAGRGTVNSWERTISNIGQTISGKTIARILIGYDHPAETGDFRGYIDDIAIYENTEITVPLTLLNFTGNIYNAAADLQWATASEVNASSTSIERSYDGVNFAFINSVAAKNSVIYNSYTYQDETLQFNADKVYYRLKFIDKDGSSRYSKVVQLSIQPAAIALKLSPNPAKSFVQLSLSSATNQKGIISITDAAGKNAITKTVTLVKGYNTLTVYEINKLIPGIYNVRLNTNGSMLVASLLIE
ncbi:T9SS type A sorting domain-containing protein [Ferruginibacter albus]|uniref:T9SS type A sorting domain-containing protein n=1 Tax=Ferruginibacter albus TaxID=2875540 RepID=UPI001CC4380D|nr:T9SS type A sorting domain-containing protein [Ferruginibacter albus]UAY52470.1 T9SS type A sorting domain-containing protein [Ferruginibacter albus]